MAVLPNIDGLYGWIIEDKPLPFDIGFSSYRLFFAYVGMYFATLFFSCVVYVQTKLVLKEKTENNNYHKYVLYCTYLMVYGAMFHLVWSFHPTIEDYPKWAYRLTSYFSAFLFTIGVIKVYKEVFNLFFMKNKLKTAINHIIKTREEVTKPLAVNSYEVDEESTTTILNKEKENLTKTLNEIID